MPIHETRVERAERRVREAEANVDRQKAKLAKLEAKGDRSGLRGGRVVMQSFKDAVVAMKLRLRGARRRRTMTKDPLKG